MTKVKNIERKNAIYNAVGATLSAFTSLVFAIIANRINGANDAGIFSIAFATAFMLYIVGVYEGRVFQVTDISKKYTDTDYLFHRVITCVILVAVSVIFVFVRGYDFLKAATVVALCGFKALEAFSECLYAMIQKKGYLYQVGISMGAKAILGTILFLIINLLTHNILCASIGIVIANVLVIVFYDFFKIKKIGISKSKFNLKKNKGIFIEGFFTFLITFLSAYLINAPRYAIDDLNNEVLQNIMGIIIMPGTFMGLMAQYVIHPKLNTITKSIEIKDKPTLVKTLNRIILTLLVLGGLVILAAYFLEAPILGMIYGVDLAPYFEPMMIVILGSVGYALSIVISYILIAYRATLFQAITYGVISIAAFFGSTYMVEQYSIRGAALTYQISMAVLSTTFFIYVYIKTRKIMRK